MNKYSILVVEDEALIAANLVQILSSLGYSVHKPVATGEDAIRSVKTRKPDLVLMDIKLAGVMDGIEAAEKIRAFVDIPIVYLTAFTDDTRLTKAQLTEPYGYILKPAHKRVLHGTIEMALYKHALDRKLKESEQKYRSLAEASTDMIYIIDRNDAVQYINTYAAQLLHSSVEQIIGNSRKELFSPQIADEQTRYLQNIFKTGMPLRSESKIQFGDQELWIDSNLVPLKDEKGNVVSVLGISRDITERKRVEEALQQVNKQLNLLSSITRHDIKNQIMVLKGYLELSQDFADDPKKLSEFIKKEQQAANTIEHQIMFTKDYQNLGAAAPAWQNMNEGIRNAMAALPLQVVHVEPDPANPELFADPLFEKVFYNLIDNALRYGGDRMKTIRFSSQEIDTGLRIVCEDDGVGISHEDKKRLFTRGFGRNTGLGLFLSREILAITGITITENGTPGKGARFEITVPKGMYRFKGGDH